MYQLSSGCCKLVYLHVKVSQGLQFAQRALQIVSNSEDGSAINESYLPSIHHFIGLAYSKLSHEGFIDVCS